MAAQAEVDDLNAQLDRWDDPAFVVAQARETTGLCVPGRDAVPGGRPGGGATRGRGLGRRERARRLTDADGAPWYDKHVGHRSRRWATVHTCQPCPRVGGTSSPTRPRSRAHEHARRIGRVSVAPEGHRDPARPIGSRAQGSGGGRRAMRVRQPHRREDRPALARRHAVPHAVLPDASGRCCGNVNPRGDRRTMRPMQERLARGRTSSPRRIGPRTSAISRSATRSRMWRRSTGSPRAACPIA